MTRAPLVPVQWNGDVDALVLAAAAATTIDELEHVRMAAISSGRLLRDTRTPTAGGHLLGSRPDRPTQGMTLASRIGLITRRNTTSDGP